MITTMRELLEDILLLQPDWSSKNTAAMQERGRLVRHGVADWLRDRLPSIDTTIDDLRVEARDGTGLKGEIPWVRVYSASRSKAATDGWYVVYLFGARGDHVYLSLMQGTTRWENGEFRPRPEPELRARVDWARRSLTSRLSVRPDLVENISLRARSSKLGPAYEAGSVAAFEYGLDDIPTESRLENDLRFLVSTLEDLYSVAADPLDLPGETAPEVVDALAVAAMSAGRRRTGQGLRLNAEDRLAIERHAVGIALRYLADEGFVATDVGATESYDIDARRDGERVFVEVKGTTTTWNDSSEIILTRNEVDLHEREFPRTMLVVVSSIYLDRAVNPPVASGGTMVVTHPWRIERANLTPITFRYTVAPSD
jgi:5-methylcytosine-specific restriction enzyme MrcB-like protein/uncharacterized protein DUF3883